MGGVADANRADTMGASDELHRVLDGTVSVSELESDSKSYYLAERIYGRETLEELGVSPPKISFRESGAVHETERIDLSSSPKLSFPLLEDEGSIPDMPTDSITDNLRNIVGSSRMRNWFIFAIAIRIIIAPWTSHLTDAVVHYLAVTDMLNGSSPYASLDFPYPPVFAIILYPLFWVLSHFSEPKTWAIRVDELEVLSASVSLSTPLVTSPLFNLVFKSPLIAADIISGVIIYSIARRISDEEIAEKATIFWLINPLTIWVSSVIGQSDPLLVMFIFLALWCSINNEWALAGSFFALSVFSKGYSLPIGVFFGVYLFFMGLLSSEKQPISSRFSDLIRFGSASAIVAILLLVPMILGNGSAVFLRRFQSNISWGGISPFVLKNLSGIMNSTEGVVFTWIVPSIEIIHSLRLEYIAGIVLCVALFTAYKGRFDEEEVRSVCIILGIAAQSYFCIFLLGRVNPQYVLLPLATFTLIYAVIEQRSRFLWLLTMTSVLVTFFGVSVVSWQYDVIPLAVFTEILDIGDLVESIISDWSGTGLITNYSFKDRAVIFGFPAWVTITCCFVMVLSKIFERGSTHQ